MLEKRYSGKVRDVYAVGDDLFLMVASDRISAFDVVFTEAIPDKGRVLTAMTDFWSGALSAIAPTHLVSTDPETFPKEADEIDDVAGRAMLVRVAEMLPIECIVRGYITGSAWREYERSQTMHGEPLPAGLRESDAFPEPVFTPSTKAATGHDVNISFADAALLIGNHLAERAREISLNAYSEGAALALDRGIVIADTKFELGMIDGELAICDEILTPDSSRFWPKDEWKPGSAPPSFDKQPVRDWAEGTGWDKESKAPTIPPEVIAETRARYISAYEQLTGLSFSDWWGVGGR